MPEMLTKKLLRNICIEHKLYATPYLNDKLYLHYRGINEITSLEEYTGLKALWLEGNCLTDITGLDQQTELKSLYLHENLIETISGLDHQHQLDNLNLSRNSIHKIDNLNHLTALTSIILSFNQLTSYEDIEHLYGMVSLQTIDLQSNKLNNPKIIEIFSSLPDLRVLYLQGNPVVKEIKHYRKYVISQCKQLRYLDDRPIFEDERRRITAWAKVVEAGGTIEEANLAERDEIKKIKQEKDDLDERNFRAFEELMRQGKEIRLQREREEANNVPAATSQGEDTPSSESKQEIEVNPYSGETIIHIDENPTLKEFREHRWSDNTVITPPPTAAGNGSEIWTEGENISATVNHSSDESVVESKSQSETTVKVIRPRFMNLLQEAQQEVTEAAVVIDSSAATDINEEISQEQSIALSEMPTDEQVNDTESEIAVESEEVDDLMALD